MQDLQRKNYGILFTNLWVEIGFLYLRPPTTPSDSPVWRGRATSSHEGEEVTLAFEALPPAPPTGRGDIPVNFLTQDTKSRNNFVYFSRISYFCIAESIDLLALIIKELRTWEKR